MARKGWSLLVLACSLWSVGISLGDTLTWYQSQIDAVNAVQGDMRILLLAGRRDESNTLYMRDTVLRDPRVTELVKDHFVAWFCDVHASQEWLTYSEGLRHVTMPLICCIDPCDLQSYVARTTGPHLPEDFAIWLENVDSNEPVSPASPPEYAGGDGTLETPFVLETASHFEQLANYPNHWDRYFVMGNDIDMASDLPILPIGDYATPFTGTLEGNGFYIKNLVYEDTIATGTVGLFGWIAGPATIRNLRLIAPVVTTSQNVIVGALAGGAEPYSAAWRCSVEGGFMNAPAASYPAGGLIGINFGQIAECYSTAAVAGGGACGGLVGRNEATGTILDCAAAGPVVSWNGNGAAGGLVGSHVGGQIIHCLANSPSVRCATAGGLIGARVYDGSPLCEGCVSNLVTGRATGNWADEPGYAWSEPLANLSNSAIFWASQWDFEEVWYMADVPRLQWLNVPPVAIARGPADTLRPSSLLGDSAEVVLDGTDSSDPQGDTLTYQWTCFEVVDGVRQTPGTLLGTKAIQVAYLPVGAYEIELVVSDGLEQSAPAVVLVIVNTTAIADAGDDILVYDDGTESQQVTLDGTESSDPDPGQTLSYLWTCATSDPDSALEVTATLGFSVGTHEVQLLVTDPLGATDSDKVQVTVEPALTAANSAASPDTVGRRGEVKDILFYVLLPQDMQVSEIDTTAPIRLLMPGHKMELTRDHTYDNKKRTVAAKISRAQWLESIGPDNGSVPVRVSIPLKTGPYVCADVTLEVVAGRGPSPFEVSLERTFGYYLNDDLWK